MSTGDLLEHVRCPQMPRLLFRARRGRDRIHRMRPTPGPGRLAPFLDTHAHAFTRAELIAAWSRRQLDTALAEGSAIRLLSGVYCGTRHAKAPRVRGEALTLWQPGGAITGPGALHLYSPQLPAPRRMDLIVPLGHRLRPHPWVTLRQTGPVHATILTDGVRSVEMPRALLDAWRYASPAERRPLLWEALWARVCTWRQLARELAQTPRVAGRRDLERVLGWFGEGATTPLEVRAKHETLADARFREFEWQVELRLGSRAPTVDMLHRRAMVVVELDGDRYHSTRQARDDDRERQTELTAAGYVVVRFGWSDIVHRPEWCRDRLLTTVAGRLLSPGRS